MKTSRFASRAFLGVAAVVLACACAADVTDEPESPAVLVQEAVSVGSFVRLLSFEGGKAKLAEVTLAANSPAAGKEIVDAGFPRDATVVAILRVGDEVMVLVTAESEDAVRAILIG